MTDFRILLGSSHSYFKKVTVTRSTFGDPTDGYRPDIFVPFVTRAFSLNLESTGVVQYSFNGFDIDGDLDSTQTSKSLIFDNRVVSKLWLKLVSGDGIIRFEAWSIR